MCEIQVRQEQAAATRRLQDAVEGVQCVRFKSFGGRSLTGARGGNDASTAGGGGGEIVTN